MDASGAGSSFNETLYCSYVESANHLFLMSGGVVGQSRCTTSLPLRTLTLYAEATTFAAMWLATTRFVPVNALRGTTHRGSFAIFVTNSESCKPLFLRLRKTAMFCHLCLFIMSPTCQASSDVMVSSSMSGNRGVCNAIGNTKISRANFRIFLGLTCESSA